jgi:hypothetical protein
MSRSFERRNMAQGELSQKSVYACLFASKLPVGVDYSDL